MTFLQVENMVFLSQKVDINMIFTDYWKVLVLNFSAMENTVFFWSKKFMERWYLLITEKFLFWTFCWWEIRSFFQSKIWWKDIYLVFLSFPWYSKTCSEPSECFCFRQSKLVPNFSTQNEESWGKTNGSKFRFDLGDLMRAIANCSGIFLSLIRPLGTVTNQNKTLFLLHTSLADKFEFKEILCFHSLNCIGVQTTFIFKLKASLTCLLNCRTIFPTFLLMIYFFDSKC